jgi:hypothetical protein
VVPHGLGGGGGGGIAMAVDAASTVKYTATATDKPCRPKNEWIGLIAGFLFDALGHSWPGACFLERKLDAPPTWVSSNASDEINSLIGSVGEECGWGSVRRRG